MEEGLLIDPVTDESVEARIPTWFKSRKNIYHIPIRFKIEEKFSEQDHIVFMFQTKEEARYFVCTDVEHYAKKFDRIFVKEINGLECVKILEERNGKTDNSNSRKESSR